ncbi:MAG TPA: NifB/NifX family molybdenum-iron cluster-binding protein [Polyangiaceae bacterium]
MKIAVACEPGSLVLGPFRKGSDLFIWEVEDGEITSRQTVVQAGGCCGGLARAVFGVELVLCSGIGHGAMHHLVEQGTPVARPNAEGMSAEIGVKLWLSGARDKFFVASDDCQHGGCNGEHHHDHPSP